MSLHLMPKEKSKETPTKDVFASIAAEKRKEEQMQSILVFYGFSDYPKELKALLDKLNKKHVGKYTPLIEPHFTAISCEVRMEDMPRFRQRLAEMHAEMRRFPVDVGGISTFESPLGKIVFLDVKRSEHVLKARERLERLLREEFPGSKMNPFYEKEKYTPHFTVALYIKEEPVLNDFIGELQKIDTKFTQEASIMKLVELPPGEKIGPTTMQIDLR